MTEEVIAGSTLVKSTSCIFVAASSFELHGRQVESTGVLEGDLPLEETVMTEQFESATLMCEEVHSFTFIEQPGDLSTLTDKHKEFAILIREFCDCSTLTAELEFSLS